MKNTLEMLKAYKVTSKYSSIKIIRLNKLDDCAISNVFVQQSKAKVSLRAVPVNSYEKKKIRYRTVKVSRLGGTGQ